MSDINVNVTDQIVEVDVTDQIVEVSVENAAGPQGPAGPGVPAGGTVGQILIKESSTDYDTGWSSTDADLGEFGLKAGYFQVDTTPTNTPGDQGTMYWDDSRETVALIMDGTIQHIGQDTFFYVKNSSGSSIPKGTGVRFDGTDGASGHIKIVPFLANGTFPSTYFVGVTAEAIGNGQFGQVMHFGELEGINTSTFTAGDLLYASTTVAGGFQTSVPVAPNNIVLVAAALNSKNNGAIVVRPTAGSNINNDEGVRIVSPTNGQVLKYNSTSGLWENGTDASSNIYNSDGTLTANRVVTMGANTLSFEKDIKVNELTLGKGNNFVPTNTALGVNALLVNGAEVVDDSRFKRNTAVGYNSQTANTEGFENTSVGYNSLLANTTGNAQVSIGSRSLEKNTTGIYNTSVGANSMLNNVGGEQNAAYGLNSLRDNTSGIGNSAYGAFSGLLNTTGGSNSILGRFGLYNNATGSNNVALGQSAGRFIGAGAFPNTITNNSIYIGYDVRPAADNETNQIVIGHQAIGLGSNTSVIGNSSTSFGRWYGNLLLGTNTDSGQRLQVVGDTLLKGSGNTSATTALTVQNSDGNSILRVRNNGWVSYGADDVGTINFSYTTSRGNPSITGKNLQWFSYNASDAAQFGRFYFTGANMTHTTGDVNEVYVGHNFSPISGVANYAQIRLVTTINQTGGANGVTRGLYVNPTLTAAADWRSIEWSNNSGWGLYGAGTANNYLNGDTAIGTTTLGTATKLTIGGSETASSAIARGTLINTSLIAAANNDVLVGLDVNPTFTNGAFTGVSNLAARFQDNVFLSKNFNGQLFFSVRNLNVDTASRVIFNLTSDALSGFGAIQKFSSGYNTTSLNVEKDLQITNGTAGDITLWNQVPTGKIKFAGGFASTAQMTLTAAGRLLLGTTTESTFLLDVNGTARVQGALTVTSTASIQDNLAVVKNQNGVTKIDISNSTSGNNAELYLSINSDSSSGYTRYGKYSTGKTAFKIFSAKDAFLYNDDVGGDIAVLNNFATGKIKFAAGGSSTVQMEIASTGAVSFSNDVAISGVLRETVTTNRQTASYTLVLADRGKLVEMNVGSANDLTIPLNSSVAFPIGTKIDIAQYGAGQTTIVATSGVTVRSANGWLKLNAQYGGASLVKIGTDEWYAFGNLNA